MIWYITIWYSLLWKVFLSLTKKDFDEDDDDGAAGGDEVTNFDDLNFDEGEVTIKHPIDVRRAISFGTH